MPMRAYELRILIEDVNENDDMTCESSSVDNAQLRDNDEGNDEGIVERQGGRGIEGLHVIIAAHVAPTSTIPSPEDPSE